MLFTQRLFTHFLTFFTPDFTPLANVVNKKNRKTWIVPLNTMEGSSVLGAYCTIRNVINAWSNNKKYKNNLKNLDCSPNTKGGASVFGANCIIRNVINCWSDNRE